MKCKHKILLPVDSIINVILALLLILFPAEIVEFLGLPFTSTNFYPSILGAVLSGTGVALFLELIGSKKIVD